MEFTIDRRLPAVLAPRERRRFWVKLKRLARMLPFSRDLLAAYFCAIDRATPRYVRATLIGAIVYFVMPFDAVPDVVAGIGFTDDASVLAAAIAAVRQHLMPRHYHEADRTLGDLEHERPAHQSV